MNKDPFNKNYNPPSPAIQELNTTQVAYLLNVTSRRVQAMIKQGIHFTHPPQKRRLHSGLYCWFIRADSIPIYVDEGETEQQAIDKRKARLAKLKELFPKLPLSSQ